MQGQLCLLTCAEWRDLSNHIRMSTIQSRKVEKKAKNHVTLTWKFRWKFGSTTTHLPFFSSNPKILCFPKNFSHQNEAYLMLSKRKNWGKKSKKRGEERKRKVKVKTAVHSSLLNPKTILTFCFLHMPKLRKLIFCIWIRRPWSLRPVNSFMVNFSSLKHDSDKKNTLLASKCKISRGEWVNLNGIIFFLMPPQFPLL